MKEKVFAIILSLALILTMTPLEVFGGTAGQVSSSGGIIISDKTYEIAPDITEREYITNNEDLTAQQMGHVMEVKLGNNAQIIAGYGDYNIESIKSGSNWKMETATKQAANAESRRKINVVGAVNGDFFDMSNGRPRGALVMNSTVVQKSSYPCFYIDKDNVPHITESSADLPEGVKEAIGGAGILVKDGKVNTNDTTKNPRTAVGIKKDGTVVLFMVDGRQAPLSVGMNGSEIAQTMIDLGCVSALNLDGGGSATFATQRAGDEVTDEEKGNSGGLTLRCSPSDGYERTISSSLLVVSTSKANGEFDHAVLTPNDDVYTPGSTVQFEAVGADGSGAAAPLPKSGLTWSITSGSELGTINAQTGKFTALEEKTGEVTVALSYEGKVVGETTIQLQWPDKLGFTNSSVSLDFGEESDLSFAPTWKGREVHYKDGDFVWSLDENSDLAYKKSVPAETYTKPGWGGYDSQVMLPLTGDIGGVVNGMIDYNNYRVYETSYEETSRDISNNDAGEIIVEETLTHKGAKLYSHVNGNLVRDNIIQDLCDETIDGLKYNVKGIEAKKTVQFSLGKLNSNGFIADSETSLKGKIKVTLKDDDSISDEIDVVVGMEPYILMDFEGGHTDPITGKENLSAEEYWTMHLGNSEENGTNILSLNEQKKYRLSFRRGASQDDFDWPTEIDGRRVNRLVSATENNSETIDRNVRFGDYAMNLAWDFSKFAKEDNVAADFGFSSAIYVDVVQPTKIGFWINVPKERIDDPSLVKMIFLGGIEDSPYERKESAYYAMDAEGKLEWNENKSRGGTTQYLAYYSHDAEGNITGSQLKDWAGKGWTWIEADLSGAQFPIGIQLGYTIRIVSPQNYKKTKGDILVDNVQLIYGTNTNDINNPVIESVVEKGSNVNLETAGSDVKFTTTQPTFDIALNDSKATDKYASGIDVTSIKLAIDGFDCTSDAEITQNPTGDSSVLLKTSQLTNGEHSLRVRVKDTYGNETIETYSFLIESEEAVNAAVSVVPQDGAAVIGDTYQLKVENQSDLQAEYVDAADVTIEIGNDYGAAIKDDLTAHVKYGEGYEKASAPEYADGKVTLHVKKQAQDEQNPVVYGKMIAALSVQIPSDARQGDTLNYAVPSGYYMQNAKGMTFSQAQSKIALSAEYTITAGQAIAAYPVTFEITDKDGKQAKNVTLYLGNDKIKNPHTFTAAGRYTVYARDDDGKRSWNYDVVVSALGTDDAGAPFGIQNNISGDGSSKKTITWLAAINGSEDAAYIKIAESEAALDSAESKAGTSRLFTFTETNSGNAYRLNEVKLSGLESGKTYYYKVGDGEKWSDVLNFTTAAADKNADTNFFVFADIQTNNTANLSAAIELVKNSDKKYAFGIQTGDAIDNVTNFSNWRAYLTTLNAGALGSIDVMHTLGNHEYYGDGSGEIAGSMFSVPTHTQGSYYSAEYGSVYAGVINDGGDILEALKEAKEDAAKSECAWKVLVLHQPIYGTESLMEEAKRREVTAAIEEAGFDAVFSGDDHAYARTYPMKGDTALKEGDREGVIYYVCGDLSSKDNEYHEQDLFAKMIPHKDYTGMYLSVEAGREKMTLNAYRYDGAILDSYTIEKSDCELGKHTFDDNCVYNMEEKTIEECSICHKSIPAEESGYTGMLATKDGSGKVMLAAGKVRTGWFALGEEIYHAGENGLIHKTKTYDTATCLEDGHIEADCECGAHYKGAYTYRKGHTWDKDHKCTICGVQGKDISNVTLSLIGKYWEYTGEKIYPKVVAKDGDYELVARSDLYGRDAYKSYKDNIEVGMGTVIFDGRGNYYGTTSIQFPIVPKSVESVSVDKEIAGTVTLKWDPAPGAQYYRIYQKAEGGDWVKVGETEECAAVITGLQSQTKYSFRIGTGKKVNGQTIRGLSWSENAEAVTPEESAVKTSDLITGISAAVQAAASEEENVKVYSVKTVEKDGKLYLMLPSFADLDNLHLCFETESTLQNVTVFGTNGFAQTTEKEIVLRLSEISGGTDMSGHMIYVSADGGSPVEICVMKSAEIPAIYLTSADAENQGRDFVDASKQNIALGSMTMLDENGSSIYENSLKQIKARGNSTFKYYPKKSYQIKLSEASDLLGTGENVKTWVLLAGYGDATQMHDKLFKDLARELEMPYTAECGWVDLYYDNEYRGTYLLSEKNSVGETGVNITDMEDAYKEANSGYGDNAAAEEGLNKYEQKVLYTAGLTEPENITGGYLIERNMNQVDEINGFYTRTGSGFNVKSPEFVGKEAMNYISEYYQEFEDAVYAKDENGNYTGKNPDTGKYYYEYCDKESLAKVVLLQQLALNPDGFLSSLYFYKDKDGLMYAGPIWDQEMTLGTGFTKKIDPGITDYHYLEEGLMEIPDFKAYLTEYYNEHFKDEIKALIGKNGKTSEYYELLKSSAQMNYVLWPYVEIGSPDVSGHLWKDGTNYDDVIEDMNSWLEKRISKIDYIYGDKTQHTTHDYVKTVTKPATYTEEGIMTYTCRICGDSYTVPIPKLTRPSGGSSGGGGGTIAVPEGNKNTVVNIEAGEKKITSVAAPAASVTEKDGKTVTRLEISQSTANDILLKAKENASTDILIQPDDSYKGKKSDVTEIMIPKSLIEDFISGTGKSLTVSVNGTRTELSDSVLTAAAAASGATTVALRIEAGEEDANIELKDDSKVLYLVGIDEDGFYHRITEKNQGDFKKIVALEKTEAEKIFAAQKEKIEKIKRGVKETKLKLKSLGAKKGIKLIWTKEKGYAVDGYQVYRSVKKNRAYGVKPFYTVNNGEKHFYINTKQLKKGRRYYYKVRGFRNIGGEMVYTSWSNKAYRKVSK